MGGLLPAASHRHDNPAAQPDRARELTTDDAARKRVHELLRRAPA